MRLITDTLKAAADGPSAILIGDKACHFALGTEPLCPVNTKSAGRVVVMSVAVKSRL